MQQAKVSSPSGFFVPTQPQGHSLAQRGPETEAWTPWHNPYPEAWAAIKGGGGRGHSLGSPPGSLSFYKRETQPPLPTLAAAGITPDNGAKPQPFSSTPGEDTAQDSCSVAPRMRTQQVKALHTHPHAQFSVPMTPSAALLCQPRRLLHAKEPSTPRLREQCPGSLRHARTQSTLIMKLLE